MEHTVIERTTWRVRMAIPETHQRDGEKHRVLLSFENPTGETPETLRIPMPTAAAACAVSASFRLAIQVGDAEKLLRDLGHE